MLEVLINHIEVYDTILYHNYVTCFCESGNLLSQWRGYTDNGGGYSIGITFTSDTTFFQQIDNLQDDSYHILRKVVYEPKEQKDRISNYIQGLINASRTALARFESIADGIPSTWSSQAAPQAINVFIDLVISFKNPAFHEEADWRLVKVMQASHKPEFLHFREGKYGLIPYLHTYICEKRDVYKFPLNQITFGPFLDPPQATASIELLVHNVARSENPIQIDANIVGIKDAGFRIR
jgi:hypothetical protein